MTDNPGNYQKGNLFEDFVYQTPPSVEISDDRMEAYIVFPEEPTCPDLYSLLAESGVVFGIDRQLVNDLNHWLLAGKKLEPRYLVATGRVAVRGQNGELILRTNKPADIILSSEDINSVDYRVYKQKQLALAEKDMPVAMIISPTAGHDGLTVTGDNVVAQNGDEVDIDLGANVVIQGRKLVSLIDGLIEYSRSGNKIKFNISEVYLVPEDVDFTTGNIDFPGSVIISGSIKAGFEVRAKNEVIATTIRGTVIAGGGVTARQGIIGGHGMAEIITEGSVYAKFVNKAKIIATDNVVVKKSIMNSEIYADNQVIVENTPGSIIGGKVFAVNGISARIYGSESYVKTDIAIFTSVSGILDMKKLMTERFELSKTLIRLENYLGTNKEILMKQGEDKKIMVDKLLIKREEMRKLLVAKDNHIKEIQKTLVMKNDSRIEVGRYAMPEVKFMIGGKFILLKEKVSRGYYFFNHETEEVDFKHGS